MTRATKAMARGWLLVFIGLCGGCEDELACMGGIGESGDCDDAGAGGDAGGDGDADADADADRYATIAAAYEAERVAKSVPGVAVAIVENGELAWSQGFGNRDTETAGAVSPDTRFRILTFVFPSLALLQLVDQGLVDLQAQLVDEDYVPEFTLTGAGPLDAAAQQAGVASITLEQLLLHTAGLQSGLMGNGILEDWPDRSDSVLDAYLTSPEFADSHYLVAPPGELYFGSALGGSLVGLIVERVARRNGLIAEDEFFPDYMRRYVFDPLGMARTTYRLDEVEADDDFAHGFNHTGARFAPGDHDNPWIRPVYGAWSTAHDLARFAQFLLDGNGEVLSRDGLAEGLLPRLDPVGWDRLHQSYLAYITDGPCLFNGICPAEGDLPEYVNVGTFAGQAAGVSVIPSRGLALVHLANWNRGYFPDAGQTAMTELLDVSAFVPDIPGDDHDPSVYVHRYLLDNGNTTGLTLRDGTLRLSSPSCTLEPIASGYFSCEGSDAVFVFDADEEVKYLVLGGRNRDAPAPGRRSSGRPRMTMERPGALSRVDRRARRRERAPQRVV